MIKKLAFILILGSLSTISIAQPDVTSAYNANKQGDYDAAVKYIEAALSDPKATAKEKVWRYRGNIYLNIAKDPKFRANYPNAITLCKESYFKGMDMDTHGDYKVEVQASLAELQAICLEGASSSYSGGNFCDAADKFTIAKEISNRFSIVDSAATFNAAFCYDKCGKKEEALKGYKECGNINYNVPDVYTYMIEILNEQGKTDDATAVLKDARTKFPKDAGLLRLEVNKYLNDNKYSEAEALLKALTETDPSNETVWFVLGVTYQKLGNKEQEEAAYRKSVELKPDYYDALFNLGAFYFNEGLDTEKTCADIPRDQRQKYDDCLAKSMVLFTKSVESLERAYNLRKEEMEIMQALKDAYYKAERMEDFARLKALIEAKK
jgi:tetratricopeptide (TPR) repeat protein